MWLWGYYNKIPIYPIFYLIKGTIDPPSARLNFLLQGTIYPIEGYKEGPGKLYVVPTLGYLDPRLCLRIIWRDAGMNDSAFSGILWLPLWVKFGRGS